MIPIGNVVFLHYWVILCRLHNSSLLQQEAESLAIRARIPVDLSPENDHIQEHCPACRTVIPAGIGDSAVCANGHYWGAFLQ